MDQDEWTPTFPDFNEEKISLEDDSLMLTRNNREICVIVQTDDADDYEGDGAVFWIDREHIYLRYNWRTWYSLSKENPDISRDITRRHSMTLNIYIGTDCKASPLPVFHIEELPASLFEEKSPQPPPGSPPDLFEDSDEGSPDDEAEEEEADEEETAEEEAKEEEEKSLHLIPPSVQYEDAETFYRSLVGAFGRESASQNDIPATYDAFLQKSSRQAWTKAFPSFKDELARRNVNHFHRVRLNGGAAEDAFSTDDTAVLIQVYQGADRLEAQCRELAAVASELVKNEEGSFILAGIFFADGLPLPDLPTKEIEQFTPGLLQELVSLYPDVPA